MPPNNNPQGPYPQQPQPQQPQQFQPSGMPQLRPLPAAPPQAEQDNSRYDFFLNEQSGSSARRALPQGGMSSFTKILIAAAVTFVILGILAVVLSSSRSSSTPVTGVLSAINTQQEIARISTDAETKLESTNLKNFAATASVTMPSAQAELISFYQKAGGKVDPEALAAQADARNNQALAAATSAGTYDSTYKTLMDQLLTSYQADLQRVAATSTSQSTQELLSKQTESAELLQTMLAQ